MKSMGSTLGSSKNSNLKGVVHFARFGRVLKHSKELFFVQIVFYSLMSLLLVSHMDLLSYYLSSFSLYFIADEPKIVKKEAVIGLSLYFLSLDGRLPTFVESFMYLIFSLLALLINYKNRFLPLPFKIWINFIIVVLLSSSLYFVLFDYAFPYTLNDFSLIYVIVQVGIISFIPILMGFALALLSFSWWLLLLNFLVVCITLAYSFLFGAIRYGLFLYILKNYSSIWMANMFFNFGPLLDMIYVSGIYAFYISLLSKRAGQSVRFWRWLY